MVKRYLRNTLLFVYRYCKSIYVHRLSYKKYIINNKNSFHKNEKVCYTSYRAKRVYHSNNNNKTTSGYIRF